MEMFVKVLNYCISFVAFITAVALVVFMLIAFVTGTYDVVLLMLDTIFLDPLERQSIFNSVNTQFLHTIAVLIILMKAYRILVEYMRNHHIDIKYVVEIAIIGSVLELLFNYGDYSEDMRLVLLGLAVTFLGFYVFRYETLTKALKDTEKRAKAMKKTG
ncbi:MAG: phosphate-starvation-inducible PsiE family protein [Patescibacteria group bacterium]